jgi:hypothetical protein
MAKGLADAVLLDTEYANLLEVSDVAVTVE